MAWNSSQELRPGSRTRHYHTARAGIPTIGTSLCAVGFVCCYSSAHYHRVNGAHNARELPTATGRLSKLTLLSLVSLLHVAVL